MTNNKQILRRRLLLLLSGSLVLFLFGSWQLPFLGPDEPRYSQVARQMVESGDYIVPRLGPNAWFEKPVLLYWMISLFYALFGVHEFSARLPSALCGLGTVWLVYVTVAKTSGRKTGITSGFVLATTAFFIGFSHAAAFDMLVTFCTTAALCSFLCYEWHPNERKYLWLLYVAAGLGVLAKGLVSLVVIGLAVGTYLIVSGKWRTVGRYHPIRGALILIAVLSVWLLPVTLIYGIRFWDEFFYQHHFVRYTTSHYHRSEGYFFYLPILIAGLYPWSAAFFFGKPADRSGRVRMLRRMCWCWFLSTLVFFSLAQSKLPGYILPAVPPLAILAGMGLAEFLNKKAPVARAVMLLALLNGALIVALFWGAQRYEISGNSIPVFASIVFGLSAVAAYLMHIRKPHWGIGALALVPISGILIFLYAVFPGLHWSESRDLSLRVAPLLKDEIKLAVYNIYDFAPVYYTNARVELTPEGYLYTITDYRHLHRYVSAKKRAFVLVGNEELDWIRNAAFFRVGIIIPGPDRSVVELTARE